MKVRLFKTSSCPYCHQESLWLTENKIKFEEVYVDRDQSLAEEMVHKSGQMGVPVTEIENDGSTEYVVGFDKDRLTELLKLPR